MILFKRVVLGFVLTLLSIQLVIAVPFQLLINDSRDLPNHIGKYYHITATSPKHFPIDIDMVLLKNNHYQVQLVSQSFKKAQNLADLSQEKGAIVAVNGGFYREHFLPNGLFMLKGKKYAHFVFNSLLSAIVNINKQGHINIYPKRAYGSIYLYSAFQAGPLLYDQGKPNTVYGDKLRNRSVIAEFQNGDIGLFYFSAIRISKINHLLGAISDQFDKKIESATNLDGGVASSFIVNFKREPIIRLESQPIKMVLLFYEANH